MPNWCQNAILFKGETSEVTKLIETVAGSDTHLSLAKIIAVPEELTKVSSPNRDEKTAERLVQLYGAKDWYDFQVQNWGTKWDVEAQIIHDTSHGVPGYQTYKEPKERFVRMEFDSAWSPPLAAIEMLAKQFPKVNIYHTWDETGCDFSGYSMYSGGELVEQQEWDSFENRRQFIEPDEDIFERFPTKEEGEVNETETISLTNNV